MSYTVSGKFIIKEDFNVNDTKSKEYNTRDMFHYDANGNLRSGTKVNSNGDYEIWTGYCYDDNCSDDSKNKAQLKIDKDGTTHVNKLCIGNNCLTEDHINNLIKVSDKSKTETADKKICIDDLCITKNQLIISNFMNNMMQTSALKNQPKTLEELSEAELIIILEEYQKLIDTEEE
jgi:hypothetical protein